MPKMKTNRGAAKRFRVSARGKVKRKRVKRKRAYQRHILTSKPAKRKRAMRRPQYVDKADEKNIKKLLPYL
jgi:large subunit ribosomal protein L35